jgi:hypothetical protein
MKIKDAKEILKENVIYISNFGYRALSSPNHVEIDEITIDYKGLGKTVFLLGVVNKNYFKEKDFYTPRADNCQSFLIINDDVMYIREYFHDAMRVIKALRTINHFKEDINFDESYIQ